MSLELGEDSTRIVADTVNLSVDGLDIVVDGQDLIAPLRRASGTVRLYEGRDRKGRTVSLRVE